MRIGFLTTSVCSHYGQALMKALWRELEPRNCSLFIFEGYSLVNHTAADYPCNMLYPLISRGRVDALISYTKPFYVSQILPDAIFETLSGITFIKLIFIGKDQFGYIVMSAPENAAATMANLCLEVQQHIENAILADEKQQVEMKL